MFDIDLPELDITERTVDVNNDYTYQATVRVSPSECPECGSAHIVKHKKQDRMIRDLNEFGHRVGIVIHGHRYQCKDCGNTFGTELSCVDKSGRLTKRLITKIQFECFGKTFKEIADVYGISQPSVKRIFEDYVYELSKSHTPYSPQVLGIDEMYLHRQYCGIFVDVIGQKVIEMTESLNEVAVKKCLKSLPDNRKIQCVTMNMRQSYKDAVIDVLGDIPIIIDKFHIIKELNSALDGIRRNFRKEMEKESRVSLKNMRFLLLTDGESLTSRQSKQLNLLLETYPQLQTPYHLKEAFRNIYQFAESREEAEQLYADWVQANADEDCHAFDGFISTVENWHTEVFNFFDNCFTSVQTESLNNVIRTVDRAGRGYTFPVLRAKILYRHVIIEKENS